MSEHTRISIDREVTLRTLAGRTLLVRALAVTGDEGGAIRVVVELSPAAWAAARADGLFNLAPEDDSPRLEPGRPVELDAVLRPDVAAVIAVEDVARDLNANDLASPAACTESWRAVSVVQAAPLPPGLEGSLKAGFRTAWAERAAATAAAAAGPVQVITAVARRHGLALEDLGEGLYRAPGRHGTVLVRLDGARCAVYVVHPRRVPADRRAEAAAWIAATNYDLMVGGFEMDIDDGEVRFRTSIDTTGARLSDALCDRLLGTALAMMAERFAQIG